MDIPSDLKFLETHEWHKVEGDIVTIGITHIAATELTDITFLQLPSVGDQLNANKAFGEIESVKATSDLYSGVTGTVESVNEELAANPGLINSDPYDKGWMLKVKISNPEELNKLIPHADYVKQHEE